MTPDEELLDTIEEIRRERFPNLSAALGESDCRNGTRVPGQSLLRPSGVSLMPLMSI